MFIMHKQKSIFLGQKMKSNKIWVPFKGIKGPLDMFGTY